MHLPLGLWISGRSKNNMYLDTLPMIQSIKGAQAAKTNANTITNRYTQINLLAANVPKTLSLTQQ